MSWILTKLRGLYRVMADGASLPDVPALNFIVGGSGSLGAAYNSAKNRIDVTLPAVSAEAVPNTVVARDANGDIAVEGITAGNMTCNDLHVYGAFAVDHDAAVHEVLTVEEAIQLTGGPLINTATDPIPVQGFIRWAAAGLMGIWALNDASDPCDILDFDPGDTVVSVGDKTAIQGVSLHVGSGGTIRSYVNGAVRLAITAAGIGFNGKAAAAPVTISGTLSSGGIGILGQLLTALDAAGLIVNSTTP
jgi:hypothetical protein